MSILHHCVLLRPPLLPQYTIFRQSPHRSPIQISSPTTHRKTLIRSSPDLFTQIEGDNVGVNNLGSDDGLGIDDSLFARRPFEGREGDKDFDRDPELAEIIGSCLDDPDKARSKMEERLRRKRNNILHTKTGSAVPMKVKFNKEVIGWKYKHRRRVIGWKNIQTWLDNPFEKLSPGFDFSNSYIWFEFYNVPLEKDVTLICDTIRSWHIVGRLGGCNSMNMQLSQSCFDKRPNYDAIQGGNVTPTTFYNIGDLEVQDNLARIWVDIGTSEALLLDVLINALTQLSSDYIGIKQVVFGGTEFENWREDLKTEDAGYSLHSI